MLRPATLAAIQKRATLAILLVSTTVFQACPLKFARNDFVENGGGNPQPRNPQPDDASKGQCVDPVGRGFPFLAEHCILPDGRTGFIE